MEKLKRYLLPSALVFVGLLAIANAQTITKAFQLSQDATGAFGVDTNNNAYFPAHILNNGSAPSVSAVAGTAATVTAGSTDFVGQFVGQAAASESYLIFSKAFAGSPFCVLSQSGGSASTIAYTTVTTGINLTSLIGTGVVNYFCSGPK